MHRFIKAFRQHGLDRWYGAVLVTYADDFVSLVSRLVVAVEVEELRGDLVHVHRLANHADPAFDHQVGDSVTVQQQDGDGALLVRGFGSVFGEAATAYGWLSPVAANLLGRTFDAAAPYQRWVSGTTEFVIGHGGKLYLAAVMDLFSRFIAGWAQLP